MGSQRSHAFVPQGLMGCFAMQMSMNVLPARAKTAQSVLNQR
jgi:hypothetical protein